MRAGGSDAVVTPLAKYVALIAHSSLAGGPRPTTDPEQTLYEFTCQECGATGIGFGARRSRCDDCYIEAGKAAYKRYKKRQRIAK